MPQLYDLMAPLAVAVRLLPQTVGVTVPDAAPPAAPPAPRVPRWASLAPGLALSAALGAACLLAGPALGGVSPMLLAILAGILLRNTWGLPATLQPGVAVAAKTLLRWGVVLLGLQLSLPGLLALGPGVLLIVAAAVTVTFTVTRLLGRALGVDADLTTLIAAGFSICGAAAVAGAQGVVRASEEKVAAAVAMVVLFGTAMIPFTVAVTAVLSLDAGTAGTFIGGSVHEVAQVVAAAGIAGGQGMLAVAVPIKLARVATLAPMVAAIAWGRRREERPAGARKPPLLPLFLVGFLAAIAIATTGLLPAGVLAGAQVVQQFLLASAMFALGAGVHVRSLIRLGWWPVVLSLLATATIVTVVAAGLLLGWGA